MLRVRLILNFGKPEQHILIVVQPIQSLPLNFHVLPLVQIRQIVHHRQDELLSIVLVSV